VRPCISFFPGTGSPDALGTDQEGELVAFRAGVLCVASALKRDKGPREGERH